MKEQEEELNRKISEEWVTKEHKKYDPDKFPKDLYEEKDEHEVIFLEKKGKGFGKSSKEIYDDSIAKFTNLTKEGEWNLFAKRDWAIEKLKRARSPQKIQYYNDTIVDINNKLEQSYARFARWVTYQVKSKRFPYLEHMDIMELIPPGIDGLRKAIKKFDYKRISERTGKPIRLSSFAKVVIERKIADFLKKKYHIKERSFKSQTDENGEREERPEENTELLADTKYLSEYDIYKKDYVEHMIKNTPDLTDRDKLVLDLRYRKNKRLYEIARRLHISEKRTTDVNNMIDSALIKIQRANNILIGGNDDNRAAHRG